MSEGEELLSIEDATARGIDKLTRHPWNECAHIRLHLLELGGRQTRGPWYELWDIDTSGQARYARHSQRSIFELDPNERAWRPWVEPAPLPKAKPKLAMAPKPKEPKAPKRPKAAVKTKAAPKAAAPKRRRKA